LRLPWLSISLVLVTVVTAWLTASRLRLSSDISALFPQSGEAAALVRWSKAFGGRDPALVLVRGEVPEDVARVADAVAASLRDAPSIDRVLVGVPAPPPLPDATLAWAYAGPAARAKLASIVTPEGMRQRLGETRSLLLAPAGDEQIESWLARDPLRLGQVPWEARAELAPGAGASGGGGFVADGGRARLVVAQPRGSAFVSGDAYALVDDVERAAAAAAVPGVTVELAGGHAVAVATEEMLKRDLAVSGTLSLVLASVAFVATFRRPRALLAVLPPLILGTLWTTGLAALFPSGVSSVAIAFAAVVVGVGVDTGVHVYAAFLDALRDGRSPTEAAVHARDETWRPTLTAAAVAAVAFASLGLSGLRAMQELGILCGAGELLTAVAIVLVTPVIGAWIERKPPPAPRPAPWVGAIDRMTATRGRAAVALAVCALPLLVVVLAGWPAPAPALVAVRPAAMAPIVADEHIRQLFGGRPGQWIVLSVGDDMDETRARADKVMEALEPLQRAGDIDGFDALGTFAPAPATIRDRLAARDALDLPSRRAAFADALRDAGFDLGATAPALEAFAHPAPPSAAPSGSGAAGDLAQWLFARHATRDAKGAVVVTYVRVKSEPEADARVRAAIEAADPQVVITGFDAIDRALRHVLSRDLVLVGGVALLLVAAAMRLALRSARHAIVAMATLACEMGVVGLAMRLLSVRWHVYDALVLPVLFGVTIDESMFLLHAAQGHSMSSALRSQGPLVAATALTTAAGFAALVACHFDGLRDLGEVGAIGVIAGLAAALVVVPAAVRLVAPDATRDAEVREPAE
jgi:predicted RND superfamily exporter protein